ncbi:MAG TPA: transcriptional repressor LexA [Nitrospinota bacterium]|nr:transcriptional repressor LexA [Nitrospinota bacterium]
MKEELTSKQEKILSFITHHIEDKGYPPTFREIGQFFGMASTNAVKKFINILEEKGYIRRSAKSARALEVIDHTRRQKGIWVPIVGRITAGEPILAVENIEERLLLDPSLAKRENTFLLRVYGDSMIEAGIHDQDLALIKPQKTAENGEIVAVLVDDEATIKRFYRKKERIVLKPANPKYEPIVIKRDAEVKIIGKVIGMIRRYK